MTRNINFLMQNMYMYISDPEEDGLSGPKVRRKCKHVFKSGKNIGEQCSTKPRNNYLFCYVHRYHRQQVSLKNFKVIRLIGKGKFGNIFLVEKIGGVDNGAVYAMKIISNINEKTMTEFTILKRNVNHPFFMKLHYSFKIKSRVYFVMDFIQGGDLFTYLCRNTMNESNVRCITAQIILAVEELHNQNIIYRDLKLENTLLDNEGNIVLADFGLSIIGKQSNGLCGTHSYMAPEIFKKNANYNFMVDWYSLGILILEMITGQQQGHSSSFSSSEPDYYKPSIPDNLSHDIKDLIYKLTEENPTIRLGSKGAQQIKNHPFFRKIKWNLMKEKVYGTTLQVEIGNKYDVSNFEKDFIDQSIDACEDIKDVGKVSTLFYFNKYD